MSALEAALEALDGGGVVVCPTETVYGLCARTDRPEAVERIFDLKGRPRDQVLQVLVGDRERVDDLAVVDERTEALMEAFMPGPLTLVLRARDAAPPTVTKEGTIGIRLPDHPVARKLLARIGCLAATSANRSGDPSPPDIAGLRDLFGDGVDAYLDGGPITGDASTVVDLSREHPRVLREGALEAAEVMARLT